MMPKKKEFLYIGAALLALLALAICANFIPLIRGSSLKLGNKFQFLGAMVTLNIIFWSSYKLYGHITVNGKRRFQFIENYSILLLFTFIMLALSWLGFVIFRNPYIYSFGHGVAGAHAQFWHNICSGLGPETSLYYNLYTDLNINNPTFYTSIFSIISCWLPIILLAPLYWLHPYPPMHIFAVAIVVISLGAPGIYLAIRAIGGSKILSLFGAIGYCVMPTAELPMLHKGDPNNLAFAIYPYFFAFLFSKRWTLLYITAFLLAMMSTPYSYSVMALSVIMAVFFNARKQAIGVFLIGFSIMLWDKAIWDRIFTTLGMVIPNFFTKGNMIHDIPTILFSSVISVFYILISLVTVSFLPLFGIRRQRVWNLPIIGMLLFALVGVGMEVLRGQGWVQPRNNNIIVPIYLSAFMAYIAIFNEDKSLKNGGDTCFKKSWLFGFLLFSSIVTMSLWFTVHYPWRIELNRSATSGAYTMSSNHSSVSVLKISPNQKKLDDLLTKINELVPQDASIAFRVDAGLEAFLTNRQKAWYLGGNPEGVEYYIVQTKAINEINPVDYPSWQEYLEKIVHDSNIILLYKDELIAIYRNTKPVKIPRLENALGWDILFNALLPEKISHSSNQ